MRNRLSRRRAPNGYNRYLNKREEREARSRYNPSGNRRTSPEYTER